MAPDWQNNSCSPLVPFSNFNGSGSCTLGNLAQYAIKVVDASVAIAGVRFAQQNNIRLTIKNTGHDYLGRSTGKGSLALWTHSLQEITVLDYSDAAYTGPAVRIGAGVEAIELVKAVSPRGLRVVGGSCPTVGVSGGWLQGGGHGPLTAAYGLGADNTLAFEVVTANSQHVTATPFNKYADLYWALSGDGGGNYGVVLSTTLKAHVDGPVAGARFAFANTNDHAFWLAVKAWFRHLLTLADMRGLKTIGTITPLGFAMDFATWTGATSSELNAALKPFIHTLQSLNISIFNNLTSMQPNYVSHIEEFTATTAYTVNVTVAGRLISRASVESNDSLSDLLSTIREISKRNPAIFNIIASNVSRTASIPNAVLPAWRNYLFHLNFGLSLESIAAWEDLKAAQEQVNGWQFQFRLLTPGGGSYINEASGLDRTWKEDYFGSNYHRLRVIKREYDQHSLFWAPVAVGSEESWTYTNEGRLCRV